MIEEAAGTRLYESKKEAAQKTIEKKDAKLKEIDSVILTNNLPVINRAFAILRQKFILFG